MPAELQPEPALPFENALQSPDNENQDIDAFRYGDLFIIGSLWVSAVRTGLLGSNWALIPTVHAARPPPPPEKPPPMRYKDLPLYQSPHYEYKDYMADKEKCPMAKARLIHECILPCVTSFRRSCQKSYCELSCDVQEVRNEIYCAIKTRKNNFKAYMRSPENLTVRQISLGVGGAIGYYLGAGKGPVNNIPKRLFFTGLGLIAAGALVFPKETDEAFRTFAYHTAKAAIAAYNYYCDRNYKMRERLPCKDDLPPPLKYRKQQNKCPQKK